MSQVITSTVTVIGIFIMMLTISPVMTLIRSLRITSINGFDWFSNETFHKNILRHQQAA